jgi:hypothetical protein
MSDSMASRPPKSPHDKAEPPRCHRAGGLAHSRKSTHGHCYQSNNCLAWCAVPVEWGSLQLWGQGFRKIGVEGKGFLMGTMHIHMTRQGLVPNPGGGGMCLVADAAGRRPLGRRMLAAAGVWEKGAARVFAGASNPWPLHTGGVIRTTHANGTSP